MLVVDSLVSFSFMKGGAPARNLAVKSGTPAFAVYNRGRLVSLGSLENGCMLLDF